MELENEYAIAARYPRLPLVVEGLKYPEPVQALIDISTNAFEAWVDAESEFTTSQQDLEEAKAVDAKAFKDSVLSGAKDPGHVHTPKAERLVERNRILMSAALVVANKAGSDVQDAIKAHAKEIVVTAIEMTREGLREQERKVMEASRLLIEAREARGKSLVGMVQVSELTRGKYSFEPSFPQQGNVVMPDIREFRVNEVCDNIETLITKGHLFPDPSA